MYYINREQKTYKNFVEIHRYKFVYINVKMWYYNNEKDKKGENSKLQETSTVQKNESIKKNQADKQVTVTSGEAQEVLSAEDKAVKAEIAKHVETNVDFRKEKQEKVQEKEIKVAFSHVEKIGDRDVVVYENDLEDEFMYNADTGKLFLFFIKSSYVEKTAKALI